MVIKISLELRPTILNVGKLLEVWQSWLEFKAHAYDGRKEITLFVGPKRRANAAMK